MADAVPILVIGAMEGALPWICRVQNDIILSCLNNVPRKLFTLDLGFDKEGSLWHLQWSFFKPCGTKANFSKPLFSSSCSYLSMVIIARNYCYSIYCRMWIISKGTGVALCFPVRSFIKKRKSFPKQSKLLAPLVHASPRYQEEVKCLPLTWFVMFVQLPC